MHPISNLVVGGGTAITLLLASGCPVQPPVEPDAPPHDPNAAASCEGVCEHWRALECAEAETSSDGETCEAVCQNVQDSGIIEWNLPCRQAIATCDQVDSCEE